MDYSLFGDIMKKELTSYDLKRIATIMMLVDHLNAAVLYAGIYTRHLDRSYYDLYNAICTLTRMSYLLFIFLQIEALKYTHNRRFYLFRLVLFGFISQVPFNMLFSKGAIYGNYNWTWSYLFSFGSLNIFFSLALSFLCIWCMDEIFKKTDSFIGYIASFLITVMGCFIGYYLHVDYNWGGILATCMAYLVSRKSSKEMETVIITFALGIWQFIRGECKMTWFAFIEFGAILGLIPISMYNGKPGKKGNKLFFYFFYPVHLFLLALLSKYLYG